jgi:hypothetical protein
LFDVSPACDRTWTHEKNGNSRSTMLNTRQQHINSNLALTCCTFSVVFFLDGPLSWLCLPVNWADKRFSSHFVLHSLSTCACCVCICVCVCVYLCVYVFLCALQGPTNVCMCVSALNNIGRPACPASHYLWQDCICNFTSTWQEQGGITFQAVKTVCHTNQRAWATFGTRYHRTHRKKNWARTALWLLFFFTLG